MSRTIYLDCTHTYNSGLNTGIQRVVKNIVQNISTVQLDLGIKIVPVVLKNGSYLQFDTFPEINNKKNTLKLQLKNLYIKFRTLSSYIFPNKMNDFLYSPRLNVYLSTTVDRVLFSKKIDPKNKVTLKSNDTLIFMDAVWLHNDYEKLQALKEDKIKIVAIIYDIIPLSYSQFCTIDLTSFLKDWYKNAVKYIDGYIAISKSVQHDVYHYIKENIDPSIEYEKFNYFYLGTHFKEQVLTENITNTFKNIFEKQNVYLTVSTIEPRKNHKYILDTFDLLWQKGIDVNYIIIGKIGWEVEELIDRIQSHNQLNKKLFLLTEVSDEQLIYAYKNSFALVFASYIEGFGLPIIESLFHGLPVIASDIKIHREIGKKNISYFDLEDTNSLLSIIENKNIKNVNKFVWQDWEESTKELILKSEVF